MTWLHDQTGEILAMAEQARRAGVFPFFRPHENIGTQVTIEGQQYLTFASNDYLGLSQHPDVKAASIRGIEDFGTGLGSSRLQATSVRHLELEKRLTEWIGCEACAIFPSGWQSLVGVLSTFLNDDVQVALDNQIHASLLDGVAMARGRYPELEERFFRHNSIKGLRRVLGDTDKPHKLVVVEGLYGADGDIAPLDEIASLCDEFDARLLVDDAHGLGAIGEYGRGAAEMHGVLDRVDILMGTFSKVFGSVGGFICGDATLIDYLRLSAGSFVYSASLPVAQIEAAAAALTIVESDAELRQRLTSNARFFRDGLASIGCETIPGESHICPVMIGDEEQAIMLGAQLMQEQGVLMLPFVYPGVPLGKARLRCNVTAAHSEDDLSRAIEALSAVGLGGN